MISELAARRRTNAPPDRDASMHYRDPTAQTSTLDSRLLDVQDLLHVRVLLEHLPVLEELSPAGGLREVANGVHGGAEEESGEEEKAGNDSHRHPQERGDEREETPDLQSRWG
jgi:hypothetical protein